MASRAGTVAGQGEKPRRPTAHAAGLAAEALAADRLLAEGWTILARRLRTPAGEIDLLAERDGLLAVVEVKRRTSLAAAAYALSPRQAARLAAAAEIAVAAHPGRGRAGIRFDLVVVDPAGRVRRIADAWRLGDAGGF